MKDGSPLIPFCEALLQKQGIDESDMLRESEPLLPPVNAERCAQMPPFFNYYYYYYYYI